MSNIVAITWASATRFTFSNRRPLNDCDSTPCVRRLRRKLPVRQSGTLAGPGHKLPHQLPLPKRRRATPRFPPACAGRLSPLGRCALSALASLKPQADEPTVWASSWGDISRTFKLTQTLSQHEDMSPADFALSVHNAVGAQAAIWLKNHASTSAVAAGPVTASCALLEAFLKLQSSPSVLVVRYEESMPELWRNNDSDSAPLPCAWSLRLTSAPNAQTIKLKTVDAANVEKSACHILDEIRFLINGTDAYAESDGGKSLALGAPVTAFLSKLWRVPATGFCFLAFFTGGILFRLLVFPSLNTFISDQRQRELRARKVVQASFLRFRSHDVLFAGSQA